MESAKKHVRQMKHWTYFGTVIEGKIKNEKFIEKNKEGD